MIDLTSMANQLAEKHSEFGKDVVIALRRGLEDS
jgi:hypothetical protein